jgi:hypothetical protein
VKIERRESLHEAGVIDEEPDKGDENANSRRTFLEMVSIDTRESRRIHGIVVGNLVGIEDSGAPLVDFPSAGSDRCLIARSIVNLRKDKLGREVILMFENGDPSKPVVMGLVRIPAENQANEIARDKRPIEDDIKGERIVLKADKEIVLRCGKSSITLTRAGKLLLRGAYLLSRSSGVNRVKGGSVQIN